MPYRLYRIMSSARSKKRVLFVCRENRVRSLTAEVLYRGRSDLEVRSAGVAEYAAAPLTAELFDWADQVFVFSPAQQRIVEARFGERGGGKRLVCLPLRDRFDYKSPELVSKLTRKLRRYLGPPARDDWASAKPAPTPPNAEHPALSPGRTLASPARNAVGLFITLFSEAKALLAQPLTQ